MTAILSIVKGTRLHP